MIGLDYGERRVGVAVSDALGIAAHPRAVWQPKSVGHLVELVLELIRELAVDDGEGAGVEAIIVGDPRHMSGEPSPMSEAVAGFRQRLAARVDIPVVLWDERLSSQAAAKALGGGGRRRRQRIDAVAASLILSSYLEHGRLAALDPEAAPDPEAEA